MRRQAALIAPLLGEGAVLDLACGIGTQAIGLALLGRPVVARDLSQAMVERGRREAARLGAALVFEVGDMRRARDEDAGRFGAVIAFDNALPHLSGDGDLGAALRAARRALAPGGRFAASIRDYDALAGERPSLDSAATVRRAARPPSGPPGLDLGRRRSRLHLRPPAPARERRLGGPAPPRPLPGAAARRAVPGRRRRRLRAPRVAHARGERLPPAHLPGLLARTAVGNARRARRERRERALSTDARRSRRRRRSSRRRCSRPAIAGAVLGPSPEPSKL